MISRKRPPSHAEKVRRFNRIKMHHPALAKLTAGIPQTVWSLAQADDEHEPHYKSANESISTRAITEDLPKRTEGRSEWYLQFLQSLAVLRYEHQLELTPHIYGPHRRPPAGSNHSPPQSSPDPLQSSLLTAEDAMKVFDGISFAMWEHGKALNAHVVIVWSMIPGINETKAAKILGRYLNEASKWVAVWGGPRAPTRQGDELHYVWVHENAPGRGFHTHILLSLDIDCHKDFDAWSRSCLIRRCKTRFHEKAFRVVPSKLRREQDQAQRVWGWFRYLMKQLDPTTAIEIRKGKKYSRYGLREILKPWRIREGLPISLTRRVGVSHSIGKKAQSKKGFVSKLRSGDFQRLYHAREFADRLGAELFKNDEHPPWHSEFQ